jgi:AraC-like DNA-binding protein
VVEKFKRAGEPGPPHFSYGAAASGEAAPAPGEDFLSEAHLYRRQPLRPVAAPGNAPASSTQWFIGSNAAFVVWVNTAAITTGRTEADIAADGLNGLVFNYVDAGRYDIDCAIGSAAFDAGALYLFDTTLPYSTVATDDRSLTIFVPRGRVKKRLGGFPSQALLRDLSAAPLAPFLIAHLRLLGERLNRMTSADFEAALEHGVELALTVAEHEMRKPADEADLLFEAALKVIEDRYHDAELTPQAVAAAIRCSRATLYRAFAARGLTIAGSLRDVRMRHVVKAFGLADSRTIGDIAFACGFGADPSNFAKQFRHVYSMSPAEARAALTRGEKLPASRRSPAEPR